MKKNLLLTAVIASALSANAQLPTSESAEGNALLNIHPKEAVSQEVAAEAKAASRASSTNPEFKLPAGVLYYALLPSYGGFPQLHGPAFTELTWKNLSSGSNFSWDYTDYASGIEGRSSSTSKDLVTIQGNTYGMGVPGPVLSNGTNTFQITSPNLLAGNITAEQLAEYQKNTFVFGGTPRYLTVDKQTSELVMGESGVNHYNPYSEYNEAYYLNFYVQAAKSEFYANSKKYWTDYAQMYMPGCDMSYEGNFCGYGERFDYPGRPYALSKVALNHALVANDEGAEVHAYIYKFENGETVGDPIGTATVTLPEQLGARNCLEFYFLDKNGEPLVIDSTILVEFDFSDELITEFHNSLQAYPTANFKRYGDINYAWAICYVTQNGSFVKKQYRCFDQIMFSGKTDTEYTYLSGMDMAFFPDFTFVNIMGENGLPEENPTFELNPEGGELSIPVSTSRKSNDWFVNVNTTNGEDFLEYSYEDLNQDYNEEDYHGTIFMEGATLKVTYDALPEGVTGRNAVMTIKVPAAELNITFTQGDVSGVESVKVEGEATSAQVFDLSGMMVRDNVKPSKATDGLSSGIYVVKCNNGTVSKKIVK